MTDTVETTPYPFLFSLGHKFKLTEPQEIMDEVVRFYTLAPGTWNQIMVDPFSLSDTLSYCESPDQACGRIENDIMTELIKYFPQGVVQCNVSAQPYGNGIWSLIIVPQVSIGGTTYYVAKTVVSQSGTLVLLNDNVDVNEYISQQKGVL